MNVKDKDASSENYAIISYSHADSEPVIRELREYDNERICYWFDESMKAGGNYETQFFEKLDKKNCKGIIYFISERFLISEACAEEMRYFLDKYGIGNPDKFCLFVMPSWEFPSSGVEAIYERVVEFLENHRPDLLKKTIRLPKHIEYFLKLNENGKAIFAVIGNTNNYIGTYCKEGQLFHDAEILFGHTQTNELTFGYFPQIPNQRIGASAVEKIGAKRPLDGKMAYNAKVDWSVIADTDSSATLLSKDLLFSVDYLDLKYPLKSNDMSMSEKIKEMFLEHFKQDESENWKIKNVRFLSEGELKILVARSQKGGKQNAVSATSLLIPKATFFSQTSNRPGGGAFWLAGDIENARRVDPWKKGLSDVDTGVETHYVRIVIDVNKK